MNEIDAVIEYETETGEHKPALPDYAVAPGEHIVEWLEDQLDDPGSPTERANAFVALAQALPLPGAALLELINGGRLDAEMAVRLSVATGVPARHWLLLERQYRKDLKRLGPEAGQSSSWRLVLTNEPSEPEPLADERGQRL